MHIMNTGTNHIPFFIADKYLGNDFQGSVNGSVLFCDISGFTSMTEDLFESGKSGAEELFIIMRKLFSVMCDGVYGNNGFISTFAGDAFTAIFPQDNGINASKAALYIRNKLPRSLSAGVKEYPISVKSGISRGTVKWEIFPSSPMSYIFTGNAIKEAGDNEGKCSFGEIILSSVPPLVLKNGGFSYTVTNNALLLEHGDYSLNGIYNAPDNISDSIQSLFINEDILSRTAVPEIRSIVPVFINIRPSGNIGISEIIAQARIKIGRYGGYFNMLDYGDKGFVILAIFGAPRTHENIIQRALGMAEELKSDFHDNIRMGLTYGPAYTGYIGSSYRGTYTSIGDTVNLAARFMQKARWGDIWISEDIGRQIYANYMVEYMGNMEFKGKKENIHFYKLKERISQSIEFHYENAFIGRSQEISAIGTFLEQAMTNSNCSVAYIHGDAGIGKTRLIFEAQKPYLSDASIIYIKCDEVLKKSLNPIEYFFKNLFNTDSITAFRDSFDSLIDSTRHIDGTDNLIKSVKSKQYIVEGFLNVNHSREYALLDAKARFNNISIVFFELISLLSSIKPVLLNIDDIQWMDDDTASLMDNMLKQTSNYRVIVLFISRESPESSSIHETISKRQIFTLSLKRLGADETIKLVSHELPYPPDHNLESLISAKTEGNPFFIEQFCLFLMESGFLEYIDNETRLSKRDIEMPQGISGIIISRIDKLTNEVKEVIQNASVLGRTFSVSILAKMLQRDIHSPLMTGEEEKIWSAVNKLQFIFRHAMIHDAVYGMQLNMRLKDIHKLAADIIEKEHMNEMHYFSELSYHYMKAGIKDKMLHYTKKAADFAIENYMNEEALLLLNRYVEHADDMKSKMLMYMKMGGVYEIQSKWKEALEIFNKSGDYFRDSDTGYYGDCLNRKGFILYRLGRKEEALELYKDAYDIYVGLNNTHGIVSIYNNRGTTLLSMGQNDEAQFYLEEAIKEISLMDKIRSMQQLLMFAHNNLGLLFMNTGRLDLAEKHFSESIRISDEIKDTRSIAFMNLGNIRFLRGELDKAEKIYNVAMENAIALGDRHMARAIMNNMGSIMVMRYEYDKALAILAESLRIARELGDREGERILLSNIGDILALKGNYDDAFKHLAEAYQIAGELNDKKGIAIALGNMGSIDYLNNNMNQAMKRLNESVIICHDNQFYAYEHQFLYYLLLSMISNDDNYNLGELAKQFANIPESYIDSSEKWKKPFILAKINAINDPENALSLFLDIAEQYDGEGQAYALKEIYGIKKSNESLNAYIKAFDKLYKTNPKHIYKLESTP